MKITVVGAGYVGLANAFLMGISRKIVVIDRDAQKIEELKLGKMPINDEYIEKYKNLVNIEYTTEYEKHYEESDVIFIATNTNYDEEKHQFNLDSIESVMEQIHRASRRRKIIVIKSTIPIGYSDELQTRYPEYEIIFSPEFLRESYALYDNLYPDRVIVGGNTNTQQALIAFLLSENILSNKEVPTLYISNREAESVKLFANSYLAMRVAFVNEVDTFCQSLKLNTKDVLDSIGHDHRIGRHYFNPSFGYGGYCLPKDSKQLMQEYSKNNIDASLIKAIVESNKIRKKFIASQILKRIKKDEIVGIYRLISKKGINNYRSSAIIDIIEILKKEGVNMLVYSPLIDEKTFLGIPVMKDLDIFKKKSDLIIANRVDDEIIDESNVYTVDIYGEN